MAIRATLSAVLLIAFAQGIVRLAVVPLWAHYDEPAHYEYVRFVLDHRRLPRIEDRDRSILRRLAAVDRSMVVCADPPATDTTPCVGPSGAFDEAPLYYILVAGALALARPATLDREVRWARLVSVLLGVAVVLIGFLTVRAAVPAEPGVALAAAGLLAAIPGPVDLMSGVNNDVGAIAASSLLIWAMALAFRDGPSIRRIVLIAVAVGVCVLTKATALVAVPLAMAGVWLVAWPRSQAWQRWVPAAALAVVGLLTVGLLWPAEWQAHTARPRAGRRSAPTPLGAHVFHVWQEGTAVPTFWQPLQGRLPPGQAVTLGAWVRTTKDPRRLPLPVLSDGRTLPAGPSVEGTPAWTFHRYTTRAAAEASASVVSLPEVETGEAQYDGIVVAVGDFPEAPPAFDDDTARGGTWGGRRFVNLVRNGSAESAWPAVRYWVDRLLPAGGVNQRLAAWLDWRRTGPVFWPALKWQFITFWAGYGTGVADGPFWTRLMFALLTAVSIAGLAFGLFVGAGQPVHGGHETRFLAFASVSVVAAIGMSVLRIDPVDANGRIAYTPAARYAYVAIVPAAILFARGWAGWWPAPWRNRGLALLVAMVFAVGAYLFVAVQRPWYAAVACRQAACEAR
jgi:hypothetical protein